LSRISSSERVSLSEVELEFFAADLALSASERSWFISERFIELATRKPITNPTNSPPKVNQIVDSRINKILTERQANQKKRQQNAPAL
jgi:hypothetical protein